MKRSVGPGAKIPLKELYEQKHQNEEELTPLMVERTQINN
jgi:hypothetical protein